MEQRSFADTPPVQLPLALAELHGALEAGTQIELHFSARHMSEEPRLQLTLEGAGFECQPTQRLAPPSKEGRVVRAIRAKTLADTVAANMRLLVCGLNPSVYAAEHGVAFGRPGNRFWPAALDAGLATRDRDPLHALREHGLGLSDLVKRATRKSAELRADEYRAGISRMHALCAWLRPAALCFVGLEGYRKAIDPKARPGWQASPLGGTPVYLMPSTSGLNAHARLEDLVDHFESAAQGPPL